MIDEKEILAARDELAGLVSAPIFETNVGDLILLGWDDGAFLCQIQQRNMRSDEQGPHWAVRVRVPGEQTHWTFFLPTEHRVVVVKAVRR